MRYFLDYKKPAEKFFEKHEDVREEYETALDIFMTGVSSKKVDVKTIKGKRNEYYRMRIGKWRVIFMITDGIVTVVSVLLAGSRGDVYKKMGGLN